MRVSPETTPNTPRPEQAVRSNDVSHTESPEKVDPSNKVAPSDLVDLSPQARDIQRAREVAQGAPEVRENKIAAARRAVQSGNLNLKGEDLAEKLLEDSLPG